MKTLTDFERGYVAAAIDGEGHIGLGRNEYKDKFHYHPRVEVSNTNRDFLEWCRIATCQGTVDIRRKDCASNKTKKVSFVWRLRVNEIPIFLEAIQSALIIKREQANRLLEFYEKCWSPHRNQYQSFTEKVIILSDVLWQELEELNRKGPT